MPKKDTRKSLTIRLSDAQRAELEKIAAREWRTLNKHVEKIIDDYLRIYAIPRN